MAPSGGACTLASHARAPVPRQRRPVNLRPGPSRAPNPTGATFASLREREFAWYFAGNAAFFMAMQMQFVLRAQLAYDLTGQASALGIVTAGASIPMIFIAPVGGLIADRVNKRTLLIATQTAAALVSLSTTLLILTGLIAYWHLFLLSFSAGAIFSLNMPARQALVPLLVPQHMLTNAVSLQMSGMNLTRILAPALGGLLIAPLGAVGVGAGGGVGWVYALTFVLFAVAVASEFRLPVHGMKAEPEEAEGFREGLTSGFRFVARTPVIAMLLAAGMLMPFFAFPVQVMLPVFADEVFGAGGGAGFGLLMGAGGVGGLIGTIISANLDREPRKGRIMFAGAIVMGGFLIAFGSTGSFALGLLFMAASNVGQMLFMSSNNTAVQAITPEDLRGRVMAIMLMSFGVMPLGTVPLTLAADAIDNAPAVVVASMIVMLLVLALAFAFVPRFRNLRLDVAEDAAISAVRAATLVAAGELTRDEADRLMGRARRTPLPEGVGRRRLPADAPDERPAPGGEAAPAPPP